MTTSPLREVTLGTLARGAAEELFADALRRVLENIEDPNTDPEAARTITLQIVIKPDEQRRIADIDIKAAHKLAGIKPVRTLAFVGRSQGQLSMVEQPEQNEIFPVPDGRPVPVPAPAKEATA